MKRAGLASLIVLAAGALYGCAPEAQPSEQSALEMELEDVMEEATETPLPSPTPAATPTPFQPPSFLTEKDGEYCVELVPLKEDLSPIKWCISNYFAQPNLNETMINRIVPNRTFHVGGVHIDTSTEPNRIYVVDSGNNRILGFEGIEMSPDREADIVIGQPSAYDSGTCNRDNTTYADPDAETLCFQPYPNTISTLESGRSTQMATDNEGNLYLVDLANNRVLKYIDPFETDTIADDVWGQDNFTERACNQGHIRPSDYTLCTEWPHEFSNSRAQVFTAGVEVDSEGNLWVADTGNNRVLRFPAGEKHADLVLGQDYFGSKNGDCQTAAQMEREWVEKNVDKSQWDDIEHVHFAFNLPMDALCKPNAVRIHPETGALYVLEGELPGRARVLVFEAPFETGMSASYELGVGSKDHPNSGLYFPRGMALDATGQGEVWVADVHNSRVVLLDSEGIVKIIGPQDEIPHYSNGRTEFSFPEGEDAFGFPNGEISFDSEGNLYIPEDWQTSYVVRFPLEELLMEDSELKSDGVLLYKGWNQVSGLTLYNTHGLSTSEGQLIASERYRLLVWDDYLEKEPGAHADRVIGQVDFESWGYNGLHVLGAQTLDDEGRIWIADNHTIHVFQTPFTGSGHTGDEDEPVAVLESKESFFWADSDEPVQFELGGVAYDADNDALYVVDWPRSRVLRVSDPLGEHPVVNMVIGQSGHAGEERDWATCNAGEGMENPSAYGLCSPRFTTFDNYGNLYIIDGSFELGGNRRVLEFDADKLVPDPDNLFPLPEANRVFAKRNFETRSCTDWMPCNPTWVAFDSLNRMVMTFDGYGSKQYQRVLLYLNPLEDQEPSYTVPLPFAQAAVAQFDSLDNLVLQDHTWNRLLVIENPFSTKD